MVGRQGARGWLLTPAPTSTCLVISQVKPEVPLCLADGGGAADWQRRGLVALLQPVGQPAISVSLAGTDLLAACFGRWPRRIVLSKHSALLPPALPRARRYALPQQAGLAILLLLFNSRLCKQNLAVQLAYTALQSNLAHRAQLLLGPLFSLQAFQSFSQIYEAGRSCSAAVLAAPHSAREAVRKACITAAGIVPAPAAAAVAAGAAAGAAEAAAAVSTRTPAALGAELCLRYQPAR